MGLTPTTWTFVDRARSMDRTPGTQFWVSGVSIHSRRTAGATVDDAVLGLHAGQATFWKVDLEGENTSEG